MFEKLFLLKHLNDRKQPFLILYTLTQKSIYTSLLYCITFENYNTFIPFCKNPFYTENCRLHLLYLNNIVNMLSGFTIKKPKLSFHIVQGSKI